MTTLIAACVLILVSAGAGYALYALAGRTEWTWTAPAVGFAGLLAMAPLAFALPGTTITVGLVALLATLAGAWLLRGTPRPDGLVWGVAMVAVAILWLCVPFVVNGRFGLLGVSFNDDTRFHLWAAEYLAHGLDVPANVLFHGYPLGPHTIAGALSRCLGLPIEAALDAVLIAGPVVAGLAAFGVLGDAAPARRFLVGLLVALPFMLASYYAQAAFKETILASLVLAYAVELRDLERSGRLSLRAGLPFGVLVAGAIAAFTYPALLFFGAITFTVGLAALAQARFERTPLSEHFSLRAVAACAGGAALVLLIALLPRLASLVDSFDVIGSSPAGSGAIAADNIGNLVSPISLFAAFSQWPIDDFRYQPHGLLRDVMVVLGVSAAAYGTIWWSQRRDFVVPTAAVTALLIFLFVRQRESAYVAAKALCVAAPLLMLMAASAVTARPPRLVVVGLLAGVAFVAGAGYSTFLTLRNAQVGPSAHEDELAELRSVVDGQKVLYLAFDNFGGVRLFGSEVTIPPVQAPAGYTIRPGKTYDTNDPLDFDWPNDETLDRYPYVITSSGTYGSTPPPNFRVVRTTRSYKLWQRTGPTPQHNVLLDEGSKTGAILDCTTTRGRAIARSGWTAVVTPKPRLFQGPAGGGVGAGATVALELDLPRGRSDLSMQYRSSQDLEVSAPGLRTTLPASLDGLGPYWKLGAVDMPEAGTLTLTITMDKPSPFFARSQFAAIPSIAATSPAPPQRKPIADACGDWVDSYYAP